MITVIFAVAVLAILGALFGFVLAFASKAFAVEVDPRQEAIVEVLPGANCGGCGFAGCSNYAESVVNGTAACNKCAPGGAATAEKIAQIMGIEAEHSEPMVAFVRCAGGNRAATKYNYDGIDDCAADYASLGNGMHYCTNGCLGHGNCVKACKFDAIHVINGVAVVDRESCKGCEACKTACPKDMIVMIPYAARFAVPCHNVEKGAITRKFCEAGCMGCKLCEKKCPHGAIHIDHNLASIDYSKCQHCGICHDVCPRNLIKQFDEALPHIENTAEPVNNESTNA